MKDYKTIWQMKRMLWTNDISPDNSLRWALDTLYCTNPAWEGQIEIEVQWRLFIARFIIANIL